MESFGNVWAEAMALGTVPIVSDISGLAEASKGKALLFEPKNHAQLAEKALCLLKNKKLFEKMSAAAKKFAFREFCPKRASEEIIGLYRKIVAQA